MVENLFPELLKLWQKRKWLTLFVAISISLGFVYLWLNPAEYASTAAFVPPSFTYSGSVNFYKFSYKGFGAAEPEDLERTAAALQSDSALFYFAKKFDLIRRYKLDDVTNIDKQTKLLRKRFKEQVITRITAFSTVEVSVYDTDPKVATEIAEAHLAYADSFVETYARRRAGLAAAIESRARLEREAQLIEDSLAAIRTEHKIYHLEYLSDVFSQHLLSSGAFQKPGFALHYDKLRALEYRQRLLEEHIADIYNEIIFRQENLTTYPTLLNVVSKPVINREVARPKRSMVLIIAALLGILLGSVTILVYESTQNRQNRA